MSGGVCVGARAWARKQRNKRGDFTGHRFAAINLALAFESHAGDVFVRGASGLDPRSLCARTHSIQRASGVDGHKLADGLVALP